MGVLPCQFKEGVDRSHAETRRQRDLRLEGTESGITRSRT